VTSPNQEYGVKIWQYYFSFLTHTLLNHLMLSHLKLLLLRPRSDIHRPQTEQVLMIEISSPWYCFAISLRFFNSILWFTTCQRPRSTAGVNADCLMDLDGCFLNSPSLRLSTTSSSSYRPTRQTSTSHGQGLPSLFSPTALITIKTMHVRQNSTKNL